MKKIFELISSVQLGGAEIIASDLAENCGKGLGNECEITLLELFSTRDNYALAKKKELAAKQIRVVTLHNGSRRGSLLVAPFHLTRLILRERPALIHSHTDLPDLVLSATMRIFRLWRRSFPAVVRTIHNTQLWRTHPRLGRWTEKAFFDEPVVAVSTHAMIAYEELRRKYRLPLSGTRQVIYNGCAPSPRRPHPFRTDPKRINVAFCGRFEDYKGMDMLIPVVSNSERFFPGRFLFHLIGDGSYRRELQQLSQRYDNILLYDPQPNVASMFHAFDYLLMPSHFEGLTLISIEASYAAVPVIASKAPGLDETLPEDWPLRFRLGHPEELHAILGKIADNKFNREQLGLQALHFVSHRFSKAMMIDAYTHLYQSVT